MSNMSCTGWSSNKQGRLRYVQKLGGWLGALGQVIWHRESMQVHLLRCCWQWCQVVCSGGASSLTISDQQVTSMSDTKLRMSTGGSVKVNEG